MESDKKYRLDWSLIGDIEMGRPTLGHMVSVEVVRMLMLTVKSVIEDSNGSAFAEKVYREAGYQTGQGFFRQYFQTESSSEVFVEQLKKILFKLGIGILNIEYITEACNEIVMTLSEDVECSGMSNHSFEMCHYTEGVISGLLEAHSGSKYLVKEVDCWCTGDRTCRFKATKLN